MTPLIFEFWNTATARGDSPQPVFAAVNERGYCIGWSVNKRAARKICDIKSGTGNGDFQLVKVMPVLS